MSKNLSALTLPFYRWWSSKRAGYKTYTGKETVVLRVQETATSCVSTTKIVQSEPIHAKTVVEMSIVALESNSRFQELINTKPFLTHGTRSKIFVNTHYLVFTKISRILLLANTIVSFNEFLYTLVSYESAFCFFVVCVNFKL